MGQTVRRSDVVSPPLAPEQTITLTIYEGERLITQSAYPKGKEPSLLFLFELYPKADRIEVS